MSIRQPEREKTVGNVTAYYSNGDEIVAKLTAMQIGSGNTVNLEYSLGYPKDRSTGIFYEGSLDIYLPDVEWNIHFNDNNATRISGIPLIAEKRVPVMEWAIGNDEFMEISPERLRKVQRILDYFKPKVEGIPIVKEYIDGFESYCVEYAERIAKRNEEQDTESEKIKGEAEKLKGTPDPLDKLVELIESESR